MTEEEKRTYQSATPSATLTVRAANSGGTLVRDGRAGLGMPPLKMVLVHIHDGHLNAAAKPTLHSIKTEEEIAEEEVDVRLIVRLIEHLNQES